MEKVSERETHLWVISVINSCKNPLQMELCENLIENYKKKYDDEFIFDINEVFNMKCVKTNYDQYKKTRQRESSNPILPKEYQKK